jgi:succinyl-CoA synthetase beta subunit
MERIVVEIIVKLFEFEAKGIFSKYGIPIPKGRIVYTSEDAKKVAVEIKRPVMIKSQVLIARRGKAGGIKSAENAEETSAIADELIGSRIKGMNVSSLLVEEKLRIQKELFVSVAIDRSARCYVILVSTSGGMNIEEIGNSPDKILRHNVRMIEGLHKYETIEIARRMGYKDTFKDGIWIKRTMSKLSNVIYNLFRVALDFDAELAEINPLIETEDEEFIAADARMIIDDNSLYRHPEIKKKTLERERGLTSREIEAKRLGISYVELEGVIGVIGNGAGLVMATLDLIKLYGGKPANFLDVGGGASFDFVKKSVKTVFSKREVKVLLISILGGITRCDEIAKGIISSIEETNESRPLVVRIVGTKEEEAKQLLLNAGIKVTDDLENAVRKAVSLAKA